MIGAPITFDKSRVTGDMYGIIYLATNTISGLKYVGQTRVSLACRRQKHIDAMRGGSETYFHCAIRKYGIESFEFTPLDESASPEELDEKERYWIGFYQTLDRSIGYNLKNGGQLNGGYLSEETKNKIGQANLGKKRSPEARAKMSVAKKGKPNPGQSERMKKAQKDHPEKYLGHTHSEETKAILSEISKGKHYSKTTEFPSVPVKCVETGQIFPSFSEASKSIGLSTSNFQRLRKNPNAVIKGFRWEILVIASSKSEPMFPAKPVQGHI